MPPKRKTKTSKKKTRTKRPPRTQKVKGRRVAKGGPILAKGLNKRIVKPTWERKPRPWEPGGRDSYHLSITSDEFISRCCMLWAHGVPNRGIAYSLGINHRYFSHWIGELTRPFRFTVDLWGEVQSVKCTFGELAERMKQTFEPIYVTKLRDLIKEAEVHGDIKTATANLKWLMEKTMPHKYGKQETLNIHNIPIAIKTAKDDDLNLEDI